MEGFEQGMFGERGYKIGHEITANCHSFCVHHGTEWALILHAGKLLIFKKSSVVISLGTIFLQLMHFLSPLSGLAKEMLLQSCYLPYAQRRC